jgi:hypothetical protein
MRLRKRHGEGVELLMSIIYTPITAVRGRLGHVEALQYRVAACVFGTSVGWFRRRAGGRAPRHVDFDREPHLMRRAQRKTLSLRKPA